MGRRSIECFVYLYLSFSKELDLKITSFFFASFSPLLKLSERHYSEKAEIVIKSAVNLPSIQKKHKQNNSINYFGI